MPKLFSQIFPQIHSAVFDEYDGYDTQPYSYFLVCNMTADGWMVKIVSYIFLPCSIVECQLDGWLEGCQVMIFSYIVTPKYRLAFEATP